MGKTDWGPALMMLAAGVSVGAAIAVWFFVNRRRERTVVSGSGDGAIVADTVGGSPDEPTDNEHIAELRARRDQLLEQLRDLQDTALAEGVAAAEGDRAQLEREAARVMRELSEAEAQPARGETATVSDKTRTARALIRVGLAVAACALIGLALWQSAREAPPDPQGMVGGPAQSSGAMAEGHPAEGQAGPLKAKDTPRLRAARAAVAADPSSVEALAELGYSLAEAGGWIEVYQTAQKLLGQDTTQADGLILMAMVRGAMRQPQQAAVLIDRVLEQDADNMRAMEVGGRLAAQAGDWQRAVKLLEPVQEKLQSKDLGMLIDSIKRHAKGEMKAPGMMGGGAMGGAMAQAGPGHPPTGTRHPPMPAGGKANASGAVSGGAVEGTVQLAEGASPPQGGVLFVIARPAGVTVGPPAAAKRLPVGSFPIHFRLDQSNAMMGASLPTELSLSARWDADGNAATHGSEDLEGQASGKVKLGRSDVEIVLAKAP